MLKPPRGAQLNLAHPQALGLVGCWLLNEGAGNKVFDLVQHQLSENTSNLPTWDVGAYGPVTKHNSSNRWNVTQAIAKQKYCPPSISIEMAIRQTANLAAQFDEYNLVSTQDTSSAQGYYLGIKQEASPPTVPRIVFQLNAGGFNGLNLDGVMQVGVPMRIVGTYVAGSRKIYVQGVQRASDTYSSGYSSTTIANGFNIGFGGGTTVIEVAWVRLWNRALQAGEVAQLYANPFAMFETPVISVAGVASEQEGFRWRNDDGSESAATWRQNQDANDSVAVDTNIRLRMLINGTGDLPSNAYRLEWKRAGDADSEYRAVSA